MALVVCINCKWCDQGENCSYCAHPMPFKKDYALYVYPPTMSCPKFERGMSESRKKYMETKEL